MSNGLLIFDSILLITYEILLDELWAFLTKNVITSFLLIAWTENLVGFSSMSH